MGYKKEGAKREGALSCSNSSKNKSKGGRRMFLRNFIRASSMTQAVHNPKHKYSWSLITSACCIKPRSMPSLDKNSKELVAQGQTGSVPSISKDFLTRSVSDVDNSAVQSEGSILALSTSTRPLDNAGESSRNPSEFVNHGHLLWNQTRKQWVSDKKKISKGPQIRDPKLSSKATYESLLGSNKRFDEPVPLVEMVNFIVDVWEQEGMYDINNVMLH